MAPSASLTTVFSSVGDASSVKIKFVPQPYATQPNLADFISHVTASTSAYTDFHMVVAWAKRSGLARIFSQLDAFRKRNGRAYAVVGVSEGGASRQGLQLLLGMTDETYVFHDAGRTFHPKVYVATGASGASVFIGSNNMTAGGLAWNYEAALWIDLDLTIDEDKRLHQSVMEYYDLLVKDTAVCTRLTSSSLDQILTSPSLRIQDEDAAYRPASSKGQEPEDDDSAAPGTVPGLFNRSAEPKRPLPKIPGASPAQRIVTPVPRPIPSSPSGTGTTAPVVPTSAAQIPAAAVVKRWFKTMDRTAAQQPPSPNTNPTGNLRLSQEGFPINHKIYFAQTFFSGLPWVPKPKDPTVLEVSVVFDVYINGQSYGKNSIVVSHAPHRIAGQNNVPTVLHWGPLSSILRQGNFVNEVVTMERLLGGKYRLIISQHAVGPFLP